jgi:hypothetical protein
MSTSSELGVSSFEWIEALFTDPAIYAIGDLLPRPDPRRGGRPPKYPAYLTVAYGALGQAYDSIRNAATEIKHPHVWKFIRDLVAETVEDPSLHLPADAPHRTWFIKRRNKAIEANDALIEHLKETGLDTALLAGMLNPDGLGSHTHPHPSRCITADGKVITPLYKNMKRGDTRTDKVVDLETGEIVEVDVAVTNFDPDQKEHVTGDRRQVVGNKFWHAEVSGDRHREEVILVVDYVPGVKGEKNSEMDVALPHLIDLTKRSPGTQAAITDAVARGADREVFIRETGRIFISPPIAKRVNDKTGEREEKEGFLRTVRFDHDDGSFEEVEIHHIGGRLARLVITEDGDKHLEPLRRVRNRAYPNEDGTHRDYVSYEVPNPRGGFAEIRERTWTNDEDRDAGFNRSELIHQIPAGDPDYADLYPGRSNSESLNRRIDDDLYLRRAQSLGAKRQLFDLLCHAFLINALTRHRYGKPAATSLQQAA